MGRVKVFQDVFPLLLPFGLHHQGQQLSLLPTVLRREQPCTGSRCSRGCALAVSVLGGAEPPSYEECHFCPPPPEYCSKGHHTVLDERGCCQVCPKLEHEECGGPCGVDGPCAGYLQCVREDPEDKHSRGTCQRQHTTVAKCCDMKRKESTGQVYVVDKESTSYCTQGCAYREKSVAHSPVYCLGNKWDSHRYDCLRH